MIGMTDRPLNLIHWFSIVSLLSILSISGLSAFLLSRYLTQNILSRDAVVMTEFVNGIITAANERHTREPNSHVHRTPPSGNHPMSAIDHYLAGHQGKLPGHNEDADAGLRGFFEMIARMPDVLRVNIFTLDGLIVWSSSKELIGVRTGHNDELEEAVSGQPTVSDRIVGQGGKPEHTIFPEPGTRFIENYLPIWSEDLTRVEAIIEIYRSPRALFEAIDRGQQMVWAIATIGGAFIYLALFAIVYRAHITLRKQQEKLVESETFAVIGEMASAVAHGLRNPLASIRSSAELMLEDDISDSHHESLTDIVTQSDRLKDWIHNFLTSAADGESPKETIAVDDVVSECTKVFDLQIKERNVDLQLRYRGNLPPISGNRDAIRHVFNNIIANSLEALPNGGSLLIETALASNGRFVDVTVRDTGEGIPEGRISDVFRPFFTTKASGLGMGLPLAKRIIERLGGEMKILSTQGQGTTLTVRLPSAG